MTAKWAAPCSLLLVMVVITWFLLPDRLTGRIVDGLFGGPERLAEEPSARLADPAWTAAEAARGDAALAERVAVPANAGAADDASPPADLPPAGHVAFQVVDASGRTRDDVRVRFLREQRFAEYSGGGDVNAKLTCGAWEASVMAIGCEPTLLAPFEIAAGETTRLGPVVLTAGSGVIEGRVIARHLGPDAALSVQLFGDGRTPCDLCRPRPDVDTPQSCECGFTAETNELALTDRRTFRFGHLAAGVYWLRAFDPEQRIVASRRVELARGGSVWQEIDVTAPTDARFELRHDPDGGLGYGGQFTGDWSSVHRESPAPIVISFRWDRKDAGGTEIAPTVDDVRASMGIPLLPLGDPKDVASEWKGSPWFSGNDDWTHVVRSRVVQQISFDLGSFVVQRDGRVVFSGNGDDERLDRERTEADTLAFESAEPGITGANLSIERLRPDLFLVKPLPRESLTVIVTCGNYSSDELSLDLRLQQFAPLLVTMRPTQEWCEQVKAIHLRAPNACTRCDGEGGETARPEFTTSFVIGEGGVMQGSFALDFGDLQLTLPTPAESGAPDESLETPDSEEC